MSVWGNRFLAAMPGFVCAGVILFCGLQSRSEDYRTSRHRGYNEIAYDDDRTARLALSLGRATKSIPAERSHEIVEAINNGRSIPQDLSNTWQKLLRLAQICTLMLDNRYFFTHGYEFETLFPNHIAYEDFEKDAEKFEKLLRTNFGLTSSQIFSETAYFTDENKRKWKLMLETVRQTDAYDGYELVSPPITTPEESEGMAALMWRLGQSRFGQSNNMTGGHQTFSLVPKGEHANSNMVAKVLANMLLLQAQFGTTIHELLDIRRLNAPENFFIRPVIFDHREFLNDIRRIGPQAITLAQIKELMYSTHIEKEFAIQMQSRIAEELSEPEEVKEMLEWSKENKSAYRMVWKYRDTRPKINSQEPEKTLFEVRIGDYVDDRPEQAMLETYIYQRLLNKAWELAKADQFWDLKIPNRNGKVDAEYWDILRLNPAASRENLLLAMGITNPDVGNFILKRGYEVVNPGFKINRDEVRSAFEIEGYTEDLVNLILPRNPKLRKDWAEMSHKQRVKAMNEMGFDFDTDFSWEKFTVLTSEFYADTTRFPFLSPDLYLESSGNWEVKSNLNGFANTAETEKAIRKIEREVPDDYFGLHIHKFVPQKYFDRLTDTQKKQFVDYLERLSFYMLITGYAENESKNPPHYLDSWSLDRYSPNDLNDVLAHLTGKKTLSSSTQKYHNVAFRPVEGGVDIEVRDIGDSVGYGAKIAEELERNIINGNFGPAAFAKDSPLFMEFKEHSAAASKPYTLETAVSEKYKLSAKQKSLLNKLQFEIYKPSMKQYMHFHEYRTFDETQPENMDTAYLRSNFENNVALPLLNYSEQSFLSAVQKAQLASSRDTFVKKVHQLLMAIEVSPEYAFLAEHDNFLYLADWLAPSKHSSKPNLNLVSKKVANVQRDLLEKLVFKLRSLSVEFVQEAKLQKMMEQSLGDSRTKRKTCTELLKGA